MKVKRNLKYATWTYDFNKHQLNLEVFAIQDGSVNKVRVGEIKLSRTYMFSIARFIVSVAQRIRIEEAKKFRGQFNKTKELYLERIGILKSKLMKLRSPKKEEPVEPKKSDQVA